MSDICRIFGLVVLLGQSYPAQRQPPRHPLQLSSFPCSLRVLPRELLELGHSLSAWDVYTGHSGLVSTNAT